MWIHIDYLREFLPSDFSSIFVTYVRKPNVYLEPTIETINISNERWSHTFTIKFKPFPGKVPILYSLKIPENLEFAGRIKSKHWWDMD